MLDAHNLFSLAFEDASRKEDAVKYSKKEKLDMLKIMISDTVKSLEAIKQIYQKDLAMGRLTEGDKRMTEALILQKTINLEAYELLLKKYEEGNK